MAVNFRINDPPLLPGQIQYAWNNMKGDPNAQRSLVVSPLLTFQTEVQFVQMPAKRASGRLPSRANQMSPLNELNGTTRRGSGPSQRAQSLLSRHG
ncbi:hypothetical protein SAMN05216573_1418 [Bradyrhizobium sp. Rc3b]|nr:hypothetical protein SAMN05216573_1418 [Bradyrhizobium sp. Rc3b]